VRRINLQDKSLNFTIFLIVLVFLNTLLTGTASADTIVSISPQKQFIEENQSFAVNIYIEPDTSISGAQFDFTFNSTLVNVKDVQEKNALSQTGATTMFNAGSIDNSQGTVSGVYSLILGKDTATGPGTLAAINLISTGRSGVCKLQLSNVIVSNSSGNAMPVTVVDGSVYVGDAESTDQSDSGSETPAEETSGGGGGSIDNGESYENIKLKEISRVFVSTDTMVSYQFKDLENPVSYVNYTALRNAGFVTASIEVLENTSGLVSAEPEGTVYKNLNIWVGKNGYSTEENIGNPVINFRVSKSWLEENRIKESNVKLNRYHLNAWNPLPTVKTGEDSDYIFFESETPGFSPFAITGQSSQFTFGPENQVPDSKESLASGPAGEENSDGALSSEKETGTFQDEDTKEDRNYQAPASGIYGTGIFFLGALLFFKRNRE
jgi:PGF-pre-PGF domain-containing protein